MTAVRDTVILGPSRMMGNYHVRFLEEGNPVRGCPYSTDKTGPRKRAFILLYFVHNVFFIQSHCKSVSLKEVLTMKSICDRKAGTILRYDREKDSVTILGEPGDQEFIFDILGRLGIEPDLLLGY